MIHFLVRRVLLGAFVMFCVTIIVYLIFQRHLVRGLTMGMGK